MNLESCGNPIFYNNDSPICGNMSVKFHENWKEILDSRKFYVSKNPGKYTVCARFFFMILCWDFLIRNSYSVIQLFAWSESL